MFSYNIVNKPKNKIEKSIIDNIFKNIDNIVSKNQNWVLNIVFLDDNSIKKLNKKYRNIDKETDVLSFYYYDDFSQIQDNEIAWEVILSEEKIKLQAKIYWLGFKWEFYKLLIHSILHILWYDHKDDNEYKIMQDLENKIYNICIWLI